MQCWSCGATVREGAKLCIYCGAKLGDEQAERGRGERAGRSRGAPPRGYVPNDQGDAPWMAAQDDSVEAPVQAPRAARDGGDDDSTYSRGRRGAGRSAYDDQGDDSREHPPALPPARRGTGGSPSRGADDQYGDPLNDPRALHGPAASQSSRSRDKRDGERRGGRDASNGRGREGRREDYGDEPRRGRGYERDYDARDVVDEQKAAYDAYNARGAYRDDDDRDPRGRGASNNGRTPRPHRDDSRERRQAAPMEDSWGMPAFGASSAEGTGRTDQSAAWGAAPSEQYPAAPARNGRPREAQRSGGARNTARRGSPPPSSGKSRMPAILALVVLAVAIAAGGAILALRSPQQSGPTSSTPSPTFIAYTPGPTPTTLPNYQLYQSDASAYILNYPKDWTQTRTADGTSGDYNDVFAPKSGIPYLSVERAEAFGPIPDSQIVQAEVNGGNQAGETFTETNGTAAIVHIAGAPWTRREFDVTMKDGTKLHMAILGCHHAGHGYAIVFAAAQGDFAALNTSTLQPILASFRFVG